MTSRVSVTVLILALIVSLAGCGSRNGDARDPRSAEAEKKVRQKFGKSLAELPTVKLVIISPHNIDIENEFEAAFSLHHAVAYGARVDIEWKDVGGGSTAILRHLRNLHAGGGGTDIDIVWGGGEYNFQKMAEEGMLRAMTLSEDVRRNIPASFGGLSMYDEQLRWCGSAVSGFGLLYNGPLLKRLKRQPPARWEDLGEARFWNLLGLADPTQSGSAAAAYEMIVQSAPSWPEGWARLLGILGNAKKFYEGAGDAADAPGLGEAPVAACIDFYGAIRVAKYPEDLIYVSPKGQTAFNPDPIAILKDPPHGELAQRFVDFVLSRRGQALWALRPGERDGPVRSPLGRQPIRKDVYTAYAGKMSPWIVNPYQSGRAMQLDKELWQKSYGVLRRLVWAAAVKNVDGLKAAKKKLIDTGFEPGRVAQFNRLPDNVASREKLDRVAELLKNKKQADLIVTDWIKFFRDKYNRLRQ